MALTPKLADELRDEALGGILAKGPLTNLRESSVLLQVVSSVALEIEAAYLRLHQLRELSDPSKCHGEDLDEHGLAVLPDGLRRGLATVAQGVLVFGREGTGSATPIASGTTALRKQAGGDVMYRTIAAGTIAVGATKSAQIPARCIVPGSVGSALVGAVNTLVNLPPGVETVSNPLPFVGRDAEGDEDYLQRMRTFVRGLSRCTPPALEGALAEAGIPWAWLVDEVAPGHSTIYVDDGAGTADVWEAVSGETLTPPGGAVGGERLLYTARRPWRAAPRIMVNGQPPAGAVFTVASWGQIRLSVPLAPGDILTTSGYEVYIGLVAKAQKVVDGDPADRVGFPGYRAAFAAARCVPAEKQAVAVTGGVVTEGGFDRKSILAECETAVVTWVNSRQPGEPLFKSRLIERILSVRGTEKVTLVAPATDVYVLPHVVIRTDGDLVSLT